MKRIPYGEANFSRLRNNNCVYIDKTMFIETLEQCPRFLFFIRPRRFGKSLFVSMLQHYYDINEQKNFQKFFGDLYIGKQPTRSRNSYLVLFLSFAGLVTNFGKELFKQSFDGYIKVILNHLLTMYRSSSKSSQTTI